MASDQLLQACTSQDLRWLGQRASYVKQWEGCRTMVYLELIVDVP